MARAALIESGAGRATNTAGAPNLSHTREGTSMALSELRLNQAEVESIGHWLEHIRRCRKCTEPGGRQANLRLCSAGSHITVKAANTFLDHLEPPRPAPPDPQPLW